MWSKALTTPAPRTHIVVAATATTVGGFAATGPPLNPGYVADPSLNELRALHLDPRFSYTGLAGQPSTPGESETLPATAGAVGEVGYPTVGARSGVDLNEAHSNGRCRLKDHLADSNPVAFAASRKVHEKRRSRRSDRGEQRMKLQQGQIAVVTGAASGIGLALAVRFASAGLSVVLADVEVGRLASAEASVRSRGVEALSVQTDVSKAESVQALVEAAVERFGAVDIVCNNAGVSSPGDPWFGPLSTWQWVMGVNFWGVVHGCRAFLPILIERGGHIVNTASIAGLMPGPGPAYDASKHAVVAISEDLHHMVKMVGLPVGVSVVCPGWVHTSILDADRNWPAELGERPQPNAGTATIAGHYRKAIDNGLAPAAVADTVIDAVEHGRFWVFPQQEFLDLAVRRFNMIAARRDPTPAEQSPGMPPRSQLVAEARAALGLSASS